MIYTIVIYFTLVLIFIFGIKPYLYKNKKRTIRFLLPMWAYVLLFVIGTIPVLNLIVLVGLIIITIIMTAIKILFPFYYWISNTAMDAMGMKMLLDIVEKLSK